jgi:dipeptidyl aminopeptidase/acylaminoacyl peptidase
MKSAVMLGVLLFLGVSCFSQDTDELKKEIKSLKEVVADYEHRFDALEKIADDNLWFSRMQDVAFVDKVYICGPAPARVKNPTAMGASNPVKFWSYVFIPKGVDLQKKYPLIVLPHGGVHGNFGTYHVHIIRELMAQGYIVVAPEYRGSNGYGKDFYRKIDYGGLEVEDVDASRAYMCENYDFVDKDRVGIVGWSHGGLIALFALFDHAESYKVGYAGVPVSDLVARMGYYDDGYRKQFSADYHLGKTAQEDIAEYRKRSPAWNVDRFKNTPLLIQSNTNDDDVNVLEVEHLVKSLKAANKRFEYEIYKDVPGGHSFDRIDPLKSREIRLKVWMFLAKELNPPVKFKSVKDMAKAAYLPISK